MSELARLRCALHARDPYEGFDAAAHPDDLTGWGSDDPNLARLIEETRPELIVEVGSWKGASAVTMARAMEARGLAGGVLCVDTWLGALEFWTDREDASRHGSLNRRHGYPCVYYTFLANVARRGLQGRIVPFPQTSLIAARWLAANAARPKLVYVDASHDEPDVAADLRAYWPLVAPGGALFGDDYDWDGVKAAVDGFAAELGAEVELRGIQWVFRRS